MNRRCNSIKKIISHEKQINKKIKMCIRDRGTSSLKQRIQAVNEMCEAGYPCGLLIAPVILVDDWKKLYTELLEELESGLSVKMKREMFLEIILMTYSYVHRAINQDAFPGAEDLYDQERMTGRGRGRYCYRPEARAEAENFLRAEIKRILGDVQILYIRDVYKRQVHH